MCYRWEKTHGLLIEGGLTYEDIKKSVSDAAIAFRDGVVELFEYLEVLFLLSSLAYC
jgi:cytosolic 5'-nucleotidase 3